MTNPEKEAVVLMQLSVNTFNLLGMGFGKAIPNVFINKISRDYTNQNQGMEIAKKKFAKETLNEEEQEYYDKYKAAVDIYVKRMKK